ncbi:MAG TPA: GSCFA domain-containing protein [Rhizomicrobium sp.]
MGISEKSPYDNLPAHAFWRTGVTEQPFDAIPQLYQRKFPIDRTMKIATAGSCFAQHIARHLRMRKFSVIDEEPAPPGLDPEDAQRFGYGLYSARYGNIYTARQLLQLAQEAGGIITPADAIWEKNGRFYDALRPSVEPAGLPSPDHVRDHRAHHLKCVDHVLRTADVFIFTLGLTETWEHAPSGTVYPTAPGTIAGKFNPAVYRFRNYKFRHVYRDLEDFFDLCKKINPGIKFLLTVSPVPLVATASGEHVLRATTYSKSLLRTAAGQFYQERDDVDYIPSYEMIMGSPSRAAFFEDNLRTVRSEGVEAVMKMFFSEHDDSADAEQPIESAPPRDNQATEDSNEDLVCEEVLLEAFAP